LEEGGRGTEEIGVLKGGKAVENGEREYFGARKVLGPGC